MSYNKYANQPNLDTGMKCYPLSLSELTDAWLYPGCCKNGRTSTDIWGQIIAQGRNFAVRASKWRTGRAAVNWSARRAGWLHSYQAMAPQKVAGESLTARARRE